MERVGRDKGCVRRQSSKNGPACALVLERTEMPPRSSPRTPEPSKEATPHASSMCRRACLFLLAPLPPPPLSLLGPLQWNAFGGDATWASLPICRHTQGLPPLGFWTRPPTPSRCTTDCLVFAKGIEDVSTAPTHPHPQRPPTTQGHTHTRHTHPPPPYAQAHTTQGRPTLLHVWKLAHGPGAPVAGQEVHCPPGAARGAHQPRGTKKEKESYCVRRTTTRPHQPPPPPPTPPPPPH